MTAELTAITAPAQPPAVAPTPRRERRYVSAAYDSAQTTGENQAHWAWADGLSARSANSPEVRRILRNRSRYEVQNNSFAKGMLRTISDYRIGTGPVLNLLTENTEYNRRVGDLFAEHCLRINFARKLWLASFAWDQDGETIALRVNNGGLRGPVKLDLQLVEADMLSAPFMFAMGDDANNDGIVFDDWGNPIAYRILKKHPGDINQISLGESDTYNASSVSHLFRMERAGQIRGIPAITPALPLFAMLRRYTLATVAAAEIAANHAGVWETSSPTDTPDELTPLEEMNVPRGMFAVGPEGWRLNQLKPEQPTTTHEMFKRAVVTEIARCMNLPYAIAAGDASQHNFASGKLDHGIFYKSNAIDQDQIEDVLAQPFFEDWFREASLAGILPDPVVPGIPRSHWLWDGQDFTDPREAQARFTALQGGFESLPRLYAKRGLDMEAEFTASAKALGVSLDEYRRLIREQLFKPAAPAIAPTETNEEDDAKA